MHKTFIFFCVVATVVVVRGAPLKETIASVSNLSQSGKFAAISGIFSDLESSGGNLTIMLPSDAAWAKVDERSKMMLEDTNSTDLLETLLLFSAADTVVERSDIYPGMPPLLSLLGIEAELDPNQGRVCVNEGAGKFCANVERWDVKFDQGVVHIIDTVLLPEEVKAEFASHGIRVLAEEKSTIDGIQSRNLLKMGLPAGGFDQIREMKERYFASHPDSNVVSDSEISTESDVETITESITESITPAPATTPEFGEEPITETVEEPITEDSIAPDAPLPEPTPEPTPVPTAAPISDSSESESESTDVSVDDGRRLYPVHGVHGYTGHSRNLDSEESTDANDIDTFYNRNLGDGGNRWENSWESNSWERGNKSESTSHPSHSSSSSSSNSHSSSSSSSSLSNSSHSSSSHSESSSHEPVTQPSPYTTTPSGGHRRLEDATEHDSTVPVYGRTLSMWSGVETEEGSRKLDSEVNTEDETLSTEAGTYIEPGRRLAEECAINSDAPECVYGRRLHAHIHAAETESSEFLSSR